MRVVSVSAVGCQLVRLIIRARGKQASIKARVMLVYICSALLISTVTLIGGYESASTQIKTDKYRRFTCNNSEHCKLALYVQTNIFMMGLIYVFI